MDNPLCISNFKQSFNTRYTLPVLDRMTKSKTCVLEVVGWSNRVCEGSSHLINNYRLIYFLSVSFVTDNKNRFMYITLKQRLIIAKLDGCVKKKII